MVTETPHIIASFYPPLTVSFFDAWNSIKKEDPAQFNELIEKLKIKYEKSPAQNIEEFQTLQIIGMVSKFLIHMFHSPEDALEIDWGDAVLSVRELWSRLDEIHHDTAAHCFRVAHLVILFGNAVAACNPDVFLWDDIYSLFGASLIHDIGKIHPSLNDILISADGKLKNVKEYMKARESHSNLGAEMAKAAGLPEFYVEVIRLHHYKPNGQDYIARAQNYLLFAQILRIADCIDSMIRRKCLNGSKFINFELVIQNIGAIDAQIEEGNLFYHRLKKAYDLLTWWLLTDDGKHFLKELFEFTSRQTEP